MGRRAAAALLGVALRTLRRYLQRYRRGGPEGFLEAAIVEAKRARPHRSARKLRDLLRLPVSREAVRRVLVRAGLNRLGQPPVKPVQRFVAAAPNALWQIDILGTVRFPLLGDLYLVRSARPPGQILACLGWTSAAWKIAVRDRWIGWTDGQRRQALPYVVNHSRFLILPWVQIQGLASHLLALCARQLPQDWARRYGVRPLLLPASIRGAHATPAGALRALPTRLISIIWPGFLVGAAQAVQNWGAARMEASWTRS